MTGPLHFSALKLMAMSPAHYKAGPQRDTRAMSFGTLVHALILGGEVVVYDGERKGAGWHAFKALVAGEPFYVYDGPRRGKAWQEAKDMADGLVIVTSEDVERAQVGRAIQAERERTGRYLSPIVTSSEHARASECAESVLADPLAAEMLTGAKEVPLTWRYLGRDCAGQLDVLSAAHVTDLKSTACAEPGWFTRQAFKMCYHAQLSFYAEGARQNGFPVEHLGIVAVEPRRPYAVTCFRLTDAAISEGERLIRMWMERLAVCEAADAWPAYCQSVVDLDVAQDVDLIWPEDETEAESAEAA